MIEVITRDCFGKDHFSVLSRIHEQSIQSPQGAYKGRTLTVLDSTKLRINANRHPDVAVGHAPWKSEWGTRKKGSLTEYYPDLDDIDALGDLQFAGLVNFIGTADLVVALTEEGEKLAEEIRGWRALGGAFVDFPDDHIKNQVCWRKISESHWQGIGLPVCPSVYATIDKTEERCFKWQARTMLDSRPTISSAAPTGEATTLAAAQKAALKKLADTSTIEK